MKKYLVFTLFIFLGFLTSCSSDDDGGTNNANPEANVLLVNLVGDSSSGIDVQWSTQTFCYTEGGCSTIDGLSFVSTFGDSKIDMASSDDSRVATGVSIPSIQVNSGSGFIEVVSAIVTTVDGFEEFEEVDTVFSSPTISSGDTYSLEYGETE